ncbi:4'-phosphopantetheinyl transferase superfamily protein [Paenibacillus sp. UNC499MF]|uniref:4'-phosphopantetheinyl transferase family protein n=1 Tax=Paenibacillus sp. UNC499MF TaxID=1502751 RepID=UPI0008A07B6D|nr:4'-phosphopantetheinyl transferase superfamily protein [Paenibacillus sp. UNC499MF]SEG50129.1 4'-phosphopantetheinyl transferase [Paenibacillus sp. UNC499MF]
MDIYAINLRLDDKETVQHADRLMVHLSEEKRAKAQKFYRQEDRIRAVAADALARWCLCRRLAAVNPELRFGTNDYGKPHLTAPRTGVHYNVTHSGCWVAAAVAEAEVGIDVEQIHQVDLDIAERFFSAAEKQDLFSLPPEERLDYFFDLWTLKESYIKAVGKGLSIPLDSFSIRRRGKGMFGLEPQPTHVFRQYEIDGPYKLSVCSTLDTFPGHVTFLRLEDLVFQ